MWQWHPIVNMHVVDEEFPSYFMFIVYGKELTQTWARLTSWKTAVSVSAPSATPRHRETWDKRRTWNIVSSHRSATPAASPTPWCSPTTTTTPGPGKVAVASSLHHYIPSICSFSRIPCNIIPCEPNRNQNWKPSCRGFKSTRLICYLFFLDFTSK